jgi:hypothetical protein
VISFGKKASKLFKSELVRPEMKKVSSMTAAWRGRAEIVRDEL